MLSTTSEAFSERAADASASVADAADVLNLPLPHVLNLLSSGVLPFHKVGGDRRVSVSALMAYKLAFEQRRSAALETLAAQAQALQMGYE